MEKELILDKTYNKASFAIKGFASFYQLVDLQNDLITEGALTFDQVPKMLLEHDQSKSIGYWTSIQSTKTGLYVEGIIEDSNAGKEAIDKIRNSKAWGLSIGYICYQHQMHGQVRVIEAASVLEISLVENPANPKANIKHMTISRELNTLQST